MVTEFFSLEKTLNATMFFLMHLTLTFEVPVTTHCINSLPASITPSELELCSPSPIPALLEVQA